MATINKETIQKIAQLARLEISDAEATTFMTQIGDVLKYIEKLNQVKTDGVEPLSQVLEIETPLREDDVRTDHVYTAELMLREAPAAVMDNFKVPQVIAGKDSKKEMDES